MINETNIARSIQSMNEKGGYILAFSKRVAADMPGLSWSQYRNLLVNNGSFCGYAEIVVRRAFGR